LTGLYLAGSRADEIRPGTTPLLVRWVAEAFEGRFEGHWAQERRSNGIKATPEDFRFRRRTQASTSANEKALTEKTTNERDFLKRANAIFLAKGV